MSKCVYLAAVEGGGTSFTCSVAKYETASNLMEIVDSKNIPSSSSPSDTLDKACSYFSKVKNIYDIKALGVACFGPLGLNPSNDMYGCILNTTPKKEWAGVNVLLPFRKVLGVDLPFSIDTDVNAPAVAEFENFNDSLTTDSSKISSLAYITVGTGVGIGLVVNGKPVHGMMHPEGGHVCISALPGDQFPGYSWGMKSPYKGNCTVEGFASSVALFERLLSSGETKALKEAKNNSDDPRAILKDLDDNNEIWEHCANALANACVTLSLLVSIERIVLGGGVMKRKILYPMIRDKTVNLLNGYLGEIQELANETRKHSSITTLDDFIIEASDNAGLIGALTLAKKAWSNETKQSKVDVVDSRASGNIRDIALGFTIGVCFTAGIFVLRRKASR